MLRLDRLGSEGVVVGGGGEGAMQFGGAPAEQLADARAGRRKPSPGSSRRYRSMPIALLVEVALERVDDRAPGVALVRNEIEGGGERRFAAVRRAIVDDPR